MMFFTPTAIAIANDDSVDTNKECLKEKCGFNFFQLIATPKQHHCVKMIQCTDQSSFSCNYPCCSKFGGYYQFKLDEQLPNLGTTGIRCDEAKIIIIMTGDSGRQNAVLQMILALSFSITAGKGRCSYQNIHYNNNNNNNTWMQFDLLGEMSPEKDCWWWTGISTS